LAAALAQRPGARFRAAPFQRAGVLQKQGDLVDAAHSLERALSLDPRSSGAVSELLFLRKQIADWHDLAILRTRFRSGVAAREPQLSPFCLLSDPSTRAEQRLCAERWIASYLPCRDLADFPRTECCASVICLRICVSTRQAC
jgi:hypothetical protein